MCNILPMKTITVSIGEGRSDFCKLLKAAKAGARVVFTNHGTPEAVLEAFRKPGQPWRVETPDDPKRYGDLQGPVMEEWT